MIDVAVRQKVVAIASVALALFVGWHVANESLGLISAIAAATLLWVASRASGIRADALLGGVVLIGYIVGNRGFAQLQPPRVPLLPGEALLLVALPIVAWESARLKTLPIQREALNFCLMAWMAVGLARIPIDVRTFGFLAVRDFAMVYYALFFFLAQSWARHAPEVKWLRTALAIGMVACTPAFYAFQAWPDWFMGRLTVWGIPLIYPKSDVVGGFMVAGALLSVYRFIHGGSRPWLVAAAASLAGALSSNSRAAMAGLGGALIWMVCLRQWRALRIFGIFAGVAIVGLVAHSALSRGPFVATPLYRLYETASSVVDFSGNKTYQSTSLGDKSDNNQFRLVWWRTIAAETMDGGPLFGLGFGADLARDFIRVYYADANEEFSARSPHNFLFTVFGRMGIAGLALFLAIIVAMGFHTVEASRQGGSTLPYWLMAWTILITAIFGVVLEGPMGAIVFWTVLGLANAPDKRDE